MIKLKFYNNELLLQDGTKLTKEYDLYLEASVITFSKVKNGSMASIRVLESYISDKILSCVFQPIIDELNEGLLEEQ